VKKALSYISWILVFCGLAIIGACSSTGFTNVVEVTPSEASELISQHLDDSDFIIIDIRTPGEFSSGHLSEAVNIDYYASDFREQLGGLNKNSTYLLYCRTGNRSSKALDIMKELNFRKVFHLTSGIVGWQSAGYSVLQ
jgi:rhodanese-related sulfurtransferase